ncbi:ATP-binding protein [Aeromonas caviae]|uniref:ATP-binding protein n=3 Tax=Aeromonas caviae TaxID=648 RepID=UPI002DBE13F1|nr:ATP-binding protein [Aeromonas caviae]MEB5775234.1 ATP-binding protein [Aeromonas caviae]MEB6650500.1 ATP-binding protein [Aeromonas caviae]
MSEEIKKTAITAAGYLYQTRQGLKLLCDWLDAPTRYTRVKFECDDDAIAPTGLDDIVAERPDDLVDLEQVKYTPNPNAHALDWTWMLEKAGKTSRSRSMLRKWFDAFVALEPARIGALSLKTNRRPDAEIEACLVGGKISFAKIPEPRRTEVLSELGDERKCEAFFSQLQIVHSDKGFESLEHEIDARLRQHGTPEGITNLKNVALNWSIRKNAPPPEGWIYLDQVRTILRATPPAPLPEDFVVPLGYEVPDETFHLEFAQATVADVGQAIVLTGPPGRGKSTYLSALCEELSESEIPTLRHHYFLSTTERGRDRVHSYVVEQSLKTQVERLHPEAYAPGSDLRGLLEACAAYYKKQGKPLVLVLDGLDHVWRINNADKRPLDDVFSQIIPCPENMVLLVGTQPVDDAQLPRDLLAVAPKASWRTLPAMSENAVLSYLCKAVDEGRLSTRFDDQEQSERQLQETASALRKKTNGHPLHVIYATAELEHAGRPLDSWNIERLQGDMTKEAKFYYSSLWEELPPSLKDTLRLVCAFPFFWPKAAFGEISAKLRTAQPEVVKVEHLLHSSTAGLKVFHESLAVFVRSTIGYDERIKELMPAVARWLETEAPPSLSVNWLWTVQARLGNPKNLISGLTRDWIMLRLEEGYPESLFDTLLSEALVAALETHAFADAYRIAHLQMRMVGGSEFQMQSDDIARLVSFTLTLTANEGVIQEAMASRHETDILDVAALGLALRARGQTVLAETCGDEALRRFRGLSRFSNRYSSNAGADEFQFLVDAFTRLGAIGATPEAFVQLVRENSTIVWMPRARILVEDGYLDDLMEAAISLQPDLDTSVLSDFCVRAAATAGVSIVDHDDFSKLRRTPFVAAVEAACKRTSKPLNEPIPIEWLRGNYYERKDDLTTLVHHWFFSGVHVSLCARADGQIAFEFVRAPRYEERNNISYFLDALSVIADQIAERWWQGEFVDFHEIFELLNPVKFSHFRQGHNASSAAADFRAGLHRVACDIRLGSCLLFNRDDVAITEATLAAAATSEWFDSASFRAEYAAGLLTRMSDEATAAFVHSQRVLLDADIREETSVHLQTPLQLCGIALTHGLNVDARELCKQVWELTTGYGHRKDPTLSNTLDAIEYLVDASPDDARRLLSLLSPQIHHVLDYTDGKGTRHLLAAADSLLARLCPAALVVKYEEHTHAGDWSHAENSLRAYVQQGVKEGWPLDALMRTGVHPEIQDELMRLERDGQDGAAERLSVLREHVGWDVGVLRHTDSPSNNIDSKPYSSDVTTFAPEQLEELLASLSDSYNEKNRLLRVWYEHWEQAGHGKRLLAVLDSLLMSDEGRRTGILELYDLAFETRRKLSGLKVAWKYLVQAQIQNGAWMSYMGEETKTCKRLDMVVKHFLSRCDEFVAATTYGLFGEPEPPRIAPKELMVYFYVRQNRLADAVRFAEVMVNCVREDTRTLPLERPRWAGKLDVSRTMGK